MLDKCEINVDEFRNLWRKKNRYTRTHTHTEK